MNEKKFLAVIPARGGSKSIKNKNVFPVNEKPLMQYTIEAVKNSKFLDRSVVSTEDSLIKEVAVHLGIEVVDRPAELSQDDVPADMPILHAIKYLEEKENYKADYVVLLQPNFPFRRAKHIDEAIELMLKNAETADSVISVVKQDHPPWWLKQINEEGYLVDFLQYDKEKLTERQHFPATYALRGCVFIAKVDVLMKKKLFNMMEKSIPYVMEEITSMEVEKLDDVRLAEFYMKEKGL